MTVLLGRHDFVFLFEVTDGNPNGDPDAGNLPRSDPETNQGLVTDVALKRKIRDFVHLKGGPGNAIFVLAKEPLNRKIAEACEVNKLPTFQRKDGKWETSEAKKRSQEDIRLLQEWLCSQYFDVRAFGAVLSTGPNAGQLRGPVQLTFARSVEPISIDTHTITRVTDVDKEEGEIGRKHTIPYGLYRAHGFVSVNFAERTGFSTEDLTLLWEALTSMFEHDRSAARGEMSSRKLVAFKHASPLGNAAAHDLFDRVKVQRKFGDDLYDLDSNRLDNLPPARRFADYAVSIDRDNLPEGIEILELV
ncbi:CRISPR-associated protein Csd2 [Rhodopseudomonas rhenobacensis]|uniref:CRISPR-associated protein Csd2 n=1 Tax=Rhodopseudomonas rhenobacensis TaxID=87461 RepID=A0A7W8DX44_9BRAD|nr:type I-C CRISPR-associated protein Cas7/Csd2 [Rhodopseudomonas rhenobacensis]MBB5045410.1 CRISPR-associated protein Csd2 [Rhodopseudomonas rhenobacensis]